jgi:hypothetical protein
LGLLLPEVVKTPYELKTEIFVADCTVCTSSVKLLMLLKIFWVVTRRHFLVCDQRFGITFLSLLQGLSLKMGQTSDPETLIIHQKVTPGNNPKYFKQHYDHSGSLQLHKPADNLVSS